MLVVIVQHFTALENGTAFGDPDPFQWASSLYRSPRTCLHFRPLKPLVEMIVVFLGWLPLIRWPEGESGVQCIGPITEGTVPHAAWPPI